MKQRIITSVAIVIGMLLLGVFSAYIVYPIALAAMAVIAVFEMLRVMGAHKNYVLAIPAYIFAPAFPIIAYFVNGDKLVYFLLALAACIFVYMLWLMGVGVFSRGSIPFSRISEVFVAVAYVSISVSSLSLIRYLNDKFGLLMTVLAFLIPWMSDVFAYICGSLFGKHKLIPEVSPKKTVEGAIGGVIFSAFFCLLYGFLADILFADVLGMRVNYLILFVFGAVLSVISQLGDLVASLIKREYGAKDYGNIFPGHGGIMDRFDSVLAVSTILMILCIICPPFTAA